MLKVRYFRLRTKVTLSDLRAGAGKPAESITLSTSVLKHTDRELILLCRAVRLIVTRDVLADGQEVKGEARTVDQHLVRFFETGQGLCLALIDPPRGSRVLLSLVDFLAGGAEIYLEPLEITRSLIQRHVKHFETAKLVSAKVKDFAIYENAVGRLEVSSKQGLVPEIAPFLDEKFYRVDSLTYLVSLQFQRGQIQYLSNGAVKASGPLVDAVFPLFERCLDGKTHE